MLSAAALRGTTQELYPYTEPASNMPANSIAPRLSANFGKYADETWQQRYVTEAMFGISKKVMFHAAASFSDMHTPAVGWEGAYVYGKYRFLSNDQVHAHFRMAAYAEAGYSKNKSHYDEINVTGDMTGFQTGLIATQLKTKLAVSATAGFAKAYREKDEHLHSFVPDEAFTYSFSAGYLVLPFEYKSYDQLNFNVYTEFLGQKAIGGNKYFLDAAPSIQFIFKSTAKLNLGYRFQLSGNEYRGMEKSFLVSLEYIFLNALKKK